MLAYRAEGALSMRAPEDVVGNEAVLNPDSGQWLRRTLDGAGAPIAESLGASQRTPQYPGTPLRSRESRPSRICAVDPTVGGRTQNRLESGFTSDEGAAWSVLIAPKAHFR